MSKFQIILEFLIFVPLAAAKIFIGYQIVKHIKNMPVEKEEEK